MTLKLTQAQKELRNMVRELTQDNPDKICELADELGMSLPTIKRWAEGKNMAHPIIAEVIVKYLKNKLQAP